MTRRSRWPTTTPTLTLPPRAGGEGREGERLLFLQPRHRPHLARRGGARIRHRRHQRGHHLAQRPAGEIAPFGGMKESGLGQPTALALKGTFEIGLREIGADIEQRTGAFFGDFIGKAVAKVQPCVMRAPSPSRIGCGDAACRGWRYRHDFKAEPVDQAGHFFADVAPVGDDQSFRHRAGGNDDLGLGFQDPYAGIRRRFGEGDRHQRRSVDGYHRGKPSGPNRKSWLLAALSPAQALAAPDARTASSIFLRVAGATAASTGTRRTTARPCLGSTTSSPASARRINSVNCPLALVTATRTAPPLLARRSTNMDQSLVQVNPDGLNLVERPGARTRSAARSPRPPAR